MARGRKPVETVFEHAWFRDYVRTESDEMVTPGGDGSVVGENEHWIWTEERDGRLVDPATRKVNRFGKIRSLRVILFEAITHEEVPLYHGVVPTCEVAECINPQHCSMINAEEMTKRRNDKIRTIYRTAMAASKDHTLMEWRHNSLGITKPLWWWAQQIVMSIYGDIWDGDLGRPDPGQEAKLIEVRGKYDAVMSSSWADVVVECGARMLRHMIDNPETPCAVRVRYERDSRAWRRTMGIWDPADSRSPFALPCPVDAKVSEERMMGA